jgi:hypothetical protein
MRFVNQLNTATRTESLELYWHTTSIVSTVSTCLGELLLVLFYFPANLPLLPAIGLFHVHGHQDQCYARYAPTFVQGIGKIDGEILETNWSVLNGISPMTRTMTLAHRTEVMDAHIADNNWKKMVNMGEMDIRTVLLFCVTHRFFRGISV